MSFLPCIKKSELTDRSVYRVNGREINAAVWNAAGDSGKGCFVGLRFKHTDLSLTVENHHEDGAPNGTCRPLSLIEKLPEALSPLCYEYPSNPSGMVKPVVNTKLLNYLLELRKRS